MPSTMIAAVLIAATMAGTAPAQPEPMAPEQSVRLTADQRPLPFPGAGSPQAPGRRTPIVILPPRPPLVFLPRAPILHRQPTGYKGAIIGALVGSGVGALVGATHPGNLDRGGAAFLGAFALGVPAGFLGHLFDF